MLRRALASSLAFVLLAACGTIPDEGADAVVLDESADDGKADGPDFTLTTVTGFDLPSSVGATETRRLFKTASSFRSYFGKSAPVDFSRSWVVFYSAGVRATGGYTARVARVRTTDSGLTLKMTTALESPGSACPVTMSMTKPWTLVSFRAPTAARYTTYYRSDSVRSCGEASTETYDGVAFTATLGARALAAANDANRDALSSVSILGSQADAILNGRPFASLRVLAARPGVGSLTLSRLKTLGQAYPQVSAFSVTADGVTGLVADLRAALDDDDSFQENVIGLVTDVSNDTARFSAVASSALAAVKTAAAGRAAALTGKSYSSRAAALDVLLDAARQVESAALADYPRGLLGLLPRLAVADKLARAKAGLLVYWRTIFIVSPEWTTNSDATWDDVATVVTAGIQNYERWQYYETLPIADGTTFVGQVDGLHTEVDVDDVGKVTRVLVEVD